MTGTIRIEDMRLFATVAEAKSFTGAARLLGVPKQTLSRRIAELERALGVSLMHRTTRRLQLSDVGAAYAERCAEIVRIAADANRAASDVHEVPRGTLRVTADPVFGEAFVTDLVIDRGEPSRPEDLKHPDCIVVQSDGTPARWPFPGERGPRLVPMSGRLTLSSFAMARAAALRGLGIAIFPEFACRDDIRRKRLVPVLGACVVDVGAIWLLYVARRFRPARIRAFLDLARERLAEEPPSLTEAARGPGRRAVLARRRARER